MRRSNARWRVSSNARSTSVFISAFAFLSSESAKAGFFISSARIESRRSESRDREDAWIVAPYMSLET